MVGAQPTLQTTKTGRGDHLRILLIGINYAPELTGIAPYTTELAEYFASLGHDVHVVTGLPHYPEWRRMPLVQAKPVQNLRLTRSWHFIPRRPNAFGRMLYEFSWLASAAPSVLRGKYDVALGTVPSLSGGLLAVLAGRRYRIPVALIVKDLMGQAAAQSGYRGGHLVAGLTRNLEGLALRRADAVVSISDGFNQYLTELGVDHRRIYRVMDWTHPGEPTERPDECRRRLGWRADEFICLHAGNMGKKQGLTNLLDAASLVDGAIRIVLSGNGNDRASLVERARKMELTNVSFVSLQAPGAYESMLRAADVLVLNQRGSVADMSLPSKLTSYFSAGRPVVAAVAAGSAAANEVLAAEAGFVVPSDDPEAVANVLVHLKQMSRERRAQIGLNGMRYATGRLNAAAGLAAYRQLVESLIPRGDLIAQADLGTGN